MTAAIISLAVFIRSALPEPSYRSRTSSTSLFFSALRGRLLSLICIPAEMRRGLLFFMKRESPIATGVFDWRKAGL